MNMASKEQLNKIAIFCDKYRNKNRASDGSLKMSAQEERKSCTNCTHFTKDHTCELDLIDKVLSSLAMENELKS